MIQHSSDQKIKLIHSIYVDEETAETGKHPRGVKRMIAGQMLDNVEANYDEVIFKRGTDHDYSIELKIVPEFKEVVTRQVLYHNSLPQTIDAAPLVQYNIVEDEAGFTQWTSNPHTIELIRTDDYIIHIDKVVFATFQINPTTIVDKKMKPDETFWGMPTNWTDKVSRYLRFAPTTDYVTPERVLSQRKWLYDPTNDLVVGVNFNFVETVIENQYRNFSDNFALFGGLFAGICSILWFLSPVGIFYFLIWFAKIIKKRY